MTESDEAKADSKVPEEPASVAAVTGAAVARDADRPVQRVGDELVKEEPVDVATTSYKDYMAADWARDFIREYDDTPMDAVCDEQLLDQLVRVHLGAPVTGTLHTWKSGWAEYSFRAGTSEQYEDWARTRAERKKANAEALCLEQEAERALDWQLYGAFFGKIK